MYMKLSLSFGCGASYTNSYQQFGNSYKKSIGVLPISI